MQVELCYQQENDGFIYEDWLPLETNASGHKAPCRVGGFDNGHGHDNTPYLKEFAASGLAYAEYIVPCSCAQCKERLRIKIRRA